MTHLVKILARNTSLSFHLQQWVGFIGKCNVPRLITTSENKWCFSNAIQPELKTSGDYATSVKKYKGKRFRPITLKQSVVRKVRSIVGISVDTFNIGWAKIDLENRSLVEYKSKDLGNENVDYLETFAYKEAKRITQLIPTSDLYVMERCFYKNKSQREFQLKLMLSSMLAALLHNPTGPVGEENVLFQNPSVTDNLYKLKVKDERVSGEQVLQRMLGTSVAEQLDTQNSDIIVSVEGITLTAERNIVKSMYFSKPTDKHSKAIALFIALSVISTNPTLFQICRQNYATD